MLPQRALSEGGVECALATSAAAFSNGYVSVPPLWFRSTSNPFTTRRAGAPPRRPWANSRARRRQFIRDQLTGRPLSWRAAAAPRRVAAYIGEESPGPLAPLRRVTIRPTALLPPLSWEAMTAPCQTVATRWRRVPPAHNSGETVMHTWSASSLSRSLSSLRRCRGCAP